MKKSIIYTESAQKKIEKVLAELKNKIEEDITLSKNYPGEELIEITASDIEETFERFHLEKKKSKVLAKNRLLKRILPVYIILGVFLMFFGLFYSEIKELLSNEPVRLMYVLTGFILALAGGALYYSILQRESESKKDFIISNFSREREIDEIRLRYDELLREFMKKNEGRTKEKE